MVAVFVRIVRRFYFQIHGYIVVGRIGGFDRSREHRVVRALRSSKIVCTEKKGQKATGSVNLSIIKLFEKLTLSKI